ncbi:hypothetical protein [Streptomyces sp. NPDC101455]|uniref:hypothetical protein n=1 Tax=Streptomyces sp. NPDC101455 TaxID=3366142 RepID=UPI00382EC3BF
MDLHPADVGGVRGHENAIADRKGQTRAQSDYTEISVLLGARLITGTRMLLSGTVVGGNSTAAWAVVDKAGERGWAGPCRRTTSGPLPSYCEPVRVVP